MERKLIKHVWLVAGKEIELYIFAVLPFSVCKCF